MERNSAYWIVPTGEILQPSAFHIQTVVKFPKKFGETDKTIQDTFDKHGENPQSNMEGKARDEIMKRVIQRGFVRIRFGGSGANRRWSVQLNKLTQKMSDIIWVWAKTIQDKVSDKYADVFIHQLSNNKMTKTSLDVIASGATIRESVVILKESECHLLPDYNNLVEKYLK